MGSNCSTIESKNTKIAPINETKTKTQSKSENEILIPWDESIPKKLLTEMGEMKPLIWTDDRKPIIPHYLSRYPLYIKCDFCDEETRTRIVKRSYPSLFGYYSCDACFGSAKPYMSFKHWYKSQKFDKLLFLFSEYEKKGDIADSERGFQVKNKINIPKYRSDLNNPELRPDGFWIDKRGNTYITIYQKENSKGLIKPLDLHLLLGDFVRLNPSVGHLYADMKLNYSIDEKEREDRYKKWD